MTVWPAIFLCGVYTSGRIATLMFREQDTAGRIADIFLAGFGVWAIWCLVR